jgi:uncharacterized protein (TIGR02147 family)
LTKNQRGITQRRFSQLAGMHSPSFLNGLLAGKRNLGAQGIEGCVRALKLKGNEAEFFRNLVAFNQTSDSVKREEYYRKLQSFRKQARRHILTDDEFEVCNTWYAVPVRELLAVPGFHENPSWIASRFNPPLTPAQAKRSLALLEKLGLVKRDEAGRLMPSEVQLATEPEVTSVAAAGFHREMLKLAAEAIDRWPREKRDISSLTLRLTSNQLSLLKQEIVDFRARLMRLEAEETTGDVVYQVCIQMFPLTISEDKK